MSDYYTAPVPSSFVDPGRPDRFLRTFKTVLHGFVGITGFTGRRIPAPAEHTRTLVVARTTVEAAAVIGLRMVDPEGRPLPAWDPGAHIDLVAPSGRTRQYSLCGDPADRSTYHVAIRRLGDSGVSAEIHDELSEGSVVKVGPPRNTFPFANPQLSRTGSTNVTFIAGGIGITALLPMIEAAEKSSTPWQLTYFGRAADTMPFLDRLAEIGADNLRTITTADSGRPDASTLTAQVNDKSAVYYCGPAEVARELHKHARDAGAVEFHFERFTPPPVVSGRPFELHLALAGETISVASDETALDAVRKHRPATPYACRQGFCGTCRVAVCGGSVDKRGTAAFLAASDTMLLCTDRAHGPSVSINI
jgi:ferredoxin-NADP reductase